MKNSVINRWLVCLFFLVGSSLISQSGRSENLPEASNLPTVPDASQSLVTDSSQKPKIPIITGLYTRGYVGNPQIIDQEIRSVDTWAGKKHSLVGFFMGIQDENPAYNIGHRLEVLRENGYTAFINLQTTHTMSEIASGNFDVDMQKIAEAFAQWSQKGEGRMAFIAPFPEMNIPGESYSLDRDNFKVAYQRLQKIFLAAGVNNDAVRWVFAPNGFSFDRDNDFENYYPTDRVDVVAFSSYNWGYCSSSKSKEWQSPAVVYGAYIDRLRKLAPERPIFIAQTAVSDKGGTIVDDRGSAKNTWLRQTYDYLAASPGIQGILYFNISKECNWPLDPNSEGADNGYPAAVKSPEFDYIPPNVVGASIPPAP